MGARLYPQGKGGLKSRYVGGALTFYNSTGAIVYVIDPTNRRFASGANSADNAGNTLRFNSITNTGTANDFIGFQCKPAQGAATAKNVVGAEIGPRVNSGFALTGGGSLIGATIAPELKGTAAGTIGGDYRCLQLEAVTDDGGTRAITGNVSMLRFRAAFSSGTISGKFVPIRIEKPEAQTNSKNFDAVFELTSTLDGVWHDTQTSATGAGFIKVLVNGNARYITLTSGAPS